jgi:hypothetical protein
MAYREPATKEQKAKAGKKIRKSLMDTPAKPKERIKGSAKNKPGSAATGKGNITVSKDVEKQLQAKADENKDASLGTLKAVYRRGAGAFSTSHHPKANRHSWAMGRVNSFLRGGHKEDDDLKGKK